MTSRSSLVELGIRKELKDLAIGLDACIEILTESVEAKTSWRLRRWAMALIRYVSSDNRGVVTALQRAKKYFARCREIAINSDEGWGEIPPVPKIPGDNISINRRRTLHQVSRVSRSLREATKEVCSDSLERHKEISLTAFETPLAVRQRFRRFLRRHFGGDARGTFGNVGVSASYLRTKHDGGAASELREITDNFRAKEMPLHDIIELAASLPTFITDRVTKVVRPEYYDTVMRSNGLARSKGLLPCFRMDSVLFPYDKESGLSLEDWEVTREWLFSLTASWLSIDLDRIPRCRQVAVSERGFKVRVATPIEAADRYLLSMINSCLLRKLEESPQTTSSLHGTAAEELDWSCGVRGNLVFSADLKSATDLFPHDLMDDAADVLSEEWPQDLRRLFRRAVGTHEMISPTGEESWLTVRGILMGSPVSWPLLSMYSAFLHSESGSNGWYAVCGDDYIGCHTYPSYRKYLAARLATGAVGSPGKDILGRESVGVFAEELVTVGRCRWIPTVSIRAVLADPKSGQPSWQQGPEVTHALERVVKRPSVRRRICERLHRDAISMLRRAKIDPFAPRWIGGAGFPGVPTNSSLVRARRMVSQSSEQVITWITRYEVAWSQTCSNPILVEQVAQDLSRHRELSQWDSGTPGEWGPLRDVVASRLGSLSWAYFLAGAVARTLRVKLGTVSKTIRVVNEQIARRGYWLIDERVVKGEGIADMVNSLEPLIRPPIFTSHLTSIVLSGTSRAQREPFLAKRDPTGPHSPEWGPRKRRKLTHTARALFP